MTYTVPRWSYDTRRMRRPPTLGPASRRDGRRVDRRFSELLQHGVDLLERSVDLLARLAARQHHLARDENEQDDLGLHHSVYQPGEELRFVARVVAVLVGETLEADRELDIARADHVLDLPVGEARGEVELLDDASVSARPQSRVCLALRASHHHLAAFEDERRRLGFTDPHDHGSKPLRVVLGIAGMHRDRLQIEVTREVARRDDILKGRLDAGWVFSGVPGYCGCRSACLCVRRRRLGTAFSGGLR
mmetsp:Transcript_16899/g.34227  ORF Transcript_16899/g.34227 Transcript_16899/m.34227 type:complete len:248 (-) Transcript_16899:122-865(-)